MEKISISKLRKHLKTLSNKMLIDQIVELANTFPKVRDYFSIKLSYGSSKEVFKNAKKTIRNEFFPVQNKVEKFTPKQVVFV